MRALNSQHARPPRLVQGAFGQRAFSAHATERAVHARKARDGDKPRQPTRMLIINVSEAWGIARLTPWCHTGGTLWVIIASQNGPVPLSGNEKLPCHFGVLLTGFFRLTPRLLNS